MSKNIFTFAVVKPNQALELITHTFQRPKAERSSEKLALLQMQVEGRIEAISGYTRCPNGQNLLGPFEVYVNENGRRKEMSLTRTITAPFSYEGFMNGGCVPILGPLVIVRRGRNDVASLRPNDLELITNLPAFKPVSPEQLEEAKKLYSRLMGGRP